MDFRGIKNNNRNGIYAVSNDSPRCSDDDRRERDKRMFTHTSKRNLFKNVGDEKKDFIKINELKINKPYIVNGIYISTKSKYGEHGIIVSSDFRLSVPKHLTDEITDILGTPEDIDAINNGEVYFMIYEYTIPEGTFRSVSFLRKDEI